MNVMDNPLFLFSAILLGVVLQQVLTTLRKRGKQSAYTILRPPMLIFWVVLGLMLILGGVTQITRSEILSGLSDLALGLGLILTGTGQTLEKPLLRGMGVIILAIGPGLLGATMLLAGDTVNGLIALGLGMGILVSILQGPIGGFGQILVGLLILISSIMLLLSALASGLMDLTTIATVVILFILSLWGIINGGIIVLSSMRRAPQHQAEESM